MLHHLQLMNKMESHKAFLLTFGNDNANITMKVCPEYPIAGHAMENQCTMVSEIDDHEVQAGLFLFCFLPVCFHLSWNSQCVDTGSFKRQIVKVPEFISDSDVLLRMTTLQARHPQLEGKTPNKLIRYFREACGPLNSLSWNTMSGLWRFVLLLSLTSFQL